MKLRFILWILAVLILLNIPGLSQFLRAINTMLHESGHAAAALLMRGEVYAIALFANTEGVTHATAVSPEGALVTALAGYPASALAAYGFAWLVRCRKERFMLVILLILSAANGILWVRNSYGLLWIVLIVLILAIALNHKKRTVSYYTALVLLGVLIADVLRAGWDIFLISLAEPAAAGDAAVLFRLTGIPAWIWGVLFCTVSAWLSLVAALTVLKSHREVRINQ